MKDIVSKVTFGFLMAQFAPGILVVYSLSFLYSFLFDSLGNSTKEIAVASLEIWSGSLVAQMSFLGFSIAAGMSIHGLHWAVLGFLENYKRQTGNDAEVYHRPSSAAESFWHNWPISLQIAVGPVKIVCEILQFLFRRLKGKCLRDLAIDENVQRIPPESMPAFQFLQDFYLHFFQFYAHTSYTLLIAFGIFLSFIISFGWSGKRLCLLIALYILTGFFFVICRIQLATLFKAEHELRDKSNSQVQGDVPNKALDRT